MVILLILSLFAGVPDDFEFPPDIAQFSSSGGQLFLGIWESEEMPAEEEDASGDLPGIIQDLLTGSGREIKTQPSCLSVNEAEATAPSLFWPVTGAGEETTGVPWLWSSAPPADSTGQALYFWSDDVLMKEFLRQHANETVYLEIEEIEDRTADVEEGIRTIRVVEVRTGDTTFADWMESRDGQ
ncbi:MAG: hypothetical protein JXA64_04445 [Candidatus Fermentibacteraceae bacterium]|nr:hypothetical protein [Candidatus Fermentibacteraceae bacterium]MBN2608343.1 hypothetical protein [Candidatus Fermentibacteraceae bacterium]